MPETREILHYGLHFIFPLVIAYVFFKPQFLNASTILLSTNLIDLDHFLSIPVFDPMRCSIAFHFLHSYPAIAIYIALFFFRKLRLISIGALLHISTDFIDCMLIPA